VNAKNNSYSGSMSSDVAVTRVINPSALIEMAGHAVLTDPYFDDHWFFPMNEPIGLRANDLPQLSAILGGHGVFDHWRMESLRDYPHKEQTPVYTATKAMARKAKRAGFPRTEVIEWGETRKISEALELQCVAGERAPGRHTNNYVLRTNDTSVFVSTEACRIEPIREFAQSHQVDVAILPIDGLRFMRKQLVMNAEEALQATAILGAHTLVPLHYSQRSFAGLIRPTSGIDQLLNFAQSRQQLSIRHAPAGQRIVVSAQAKRLAEPGAR
jgi:L-ascorbate metabolism protein UlaG (beta-lactamase superfamily)